MWSSRWKLLGLVGVVGGAILGPTECYSQGAEVRVPMGLRVISAGRMVVGAGPAAQRLLLGGVWTPSPSGRHWPGDYRGDEARDRVRSLVQESETTISLRWNPRGGRDPLVRFLVSIPSSMEAPRLLEPGEDSSDDRADLAVLLAFEGLALCDRTTASDRLHADAICAAEREARRGRRGLHDGGFLESWSRRNDLVEIGELPETRPSPGDTAAAPGWWASDDSAWILSAPEPQAPTKAVPPIKRRKGKKKGGEEDSDRDR